MTDKYLHYFTLYICIYHNHIVLNNIWSISRKTQESFNPTKKPTIFTSIQTTRHQSLKKFHEQLKKDSQISHHQKRFFRSHPFTRNNT